MHDGSSGYVLGLKEIDQTQIALVGGKGANLGELSRLEGIRVPAGFCITTAAFRRIMTELRSLDGRLDRLSTLSPDDRAEIEALSAEIRSAIEGAAIPDDLAAQIIDALSRFGEHGGYAVRSSATAEDLPSASFAGQQDSYLNLVGPAAVLRHVRRCWASLFTERAVIYRLRNGVDHRKVHMAVVVQQMILPQAAGVLFTADPITGNRKVASIEAVFGLGEALVSGTVKADAYVVRDGAVVTERLATERAALTDAQATRLARLGRHIEAHFGCPQDIEWCLADGDFHIVQARPITTLFPVPAANDDENHVYLSVGHQQMMTDAMKPLGLSLFQLTAMAPMLEAGGRLFVDVTRRLASPTSRGALLEMMGKTHPLIRDAVESILERRDFIRPVPDDGPSPMPVGAAAAPIETDPAIVAALIERGRASIATLKNDIRGKSGTALFEFLLADIQEMKRLLFDPQSHRAIMAGTEATWWLNDRLQAWLGEKNAADVVTQSVSDNVTSEMGLALLDVADVIRPHREVVAFLRGVEDDGFLEDLVEIPGGREARDAILDYLEKYGMRCAGEIDITRPRFRERPTTLVPILLGNVENFEPGAGKRRFEQGRQEAARKEQELLGRLRALPEGELKAEETKRMIDRVRTFAGYREYPKYGIVSRYDVYKRALLEEAERLVHDGVLGEKEDIFYLRFQELHEVVRTRKVDESLIRQRKDAHRTNQALTPPRVLTSDGESVAGSYRRDGIPAGALVGQAVSAGTVEGRARVVLDMGKANVGPDDILVTAYTDPSWTPLFVGIKGLVTEVGGLMTHGAVIAREYGLPAVVAVENATRLIRDGQRIRVHGSEGYIELLST